MLKRLYLEYCPCVCIIPLCLAYELIWIQNKEYKGLLRLLSQISTSFLEHMIGDKRVIRLRIVQLGDSLFEAIAIDRHTNALGWLIEINTSKLFACLFSGIKYQLMTSCLARYK